MVAKNASLQRTTATMRFRLDKPAFTQIGLCHDFCIRKNTCQSATPTAQLRIVADVVRKTAQIFGEEQPPSVAVAETLKIMRVHNDI